MKTCQKCGQGNQDSFQKCISCNSDIGGVPSDGRAVKIPDNDEILSKSQYTEEDGGAQFIGLAGAGIGVLICIGYCTSRGWAEGLYSGGPLIIVGYFVGKRIGKRFGKSE